MSSELLIASFFKAVEKDDHLKVREILREGFAPNTKLALWNPLTPLLHAVNHEAAKIACALMEFGAMPAEKPIGGAESPIEKAKKHLNPLLHKLLLSVEMADCFSHSLEEYKQMTLEDFIKQLPYQHKTIYKMIELRAKRWIAQSRQNGIVIDEKAILLSQKMEELISAINGGNHVEYPELDRYGKDGGDCETKPLSTFDIQAVPKYDLYSNMENTYKTFEVESVGLAPVIEENS